MSVELTGRFVLLAGDGPVGLRWAACAWSVARDLSLPFAAFRVGPAGDVIDRTSSWHAAYGIEPDGAVLFTPDGRVGWCSKHTVANPIAELTRALSNLLEQWGP